MASRAGLAEPAATLQHLDSGAAGLAGRRETEHLPLPPWRPALRPSRLGGGHVAAEEAGCRRGRGCSGTADPTACGRSGIRERVPAAFPHLDGHTIHLCSCSGGHLWCTGPSQSRRRGEVPRRVPLLVVCRRGAGSQMQRAGSAATSSTRSTTRPHASPAHRQPPWHFVTPQPPEPAQRACRVFAAIGVQRQTRLHINLGNRRAAAVH